MPTLNWIGKEAVINHHREVPCRLLKPDPALGLAGTDGSGGNILTRTVLDLLPPHAGERSVYAAATRLGEAALRRSGITFKQTPYAIGV